MALMIPPLELVPFGVAAPALALALMGLALTAQDGLVLLLALGAASGGLWALLILALRQTPFPDFARCHLKPGEQVMTDSDGRKKNAADSGGKPDPATPAKDVKRTGRESTRRAGPDGPDAKVIGDTFKR